MDPQQFNVVGWQMLILKACHLFSNQVTDKLPWKGTLTYISRVMDKFFEDCQEMTHVHISLAPVY